MIVAIEGPDNAGKTTLAQTLTKLLKGVYLKTEKVPAKDTDLIPYTNLLMVAWTYSDYVFSDRVASISEPIYGSILRGGHDLKTETAGYQLSRLHAIIYCRPSEKVILKTINDRPQMAGVTDHTAQLIEAYDGVMDQLSGDGLLILKFDYTKDLVSDLVDRLQAIKQALTERPPFIANISPPKSQGGVNGSN